MKGQAPIPTPSVRFLSSKHVADLLAVKVRTFQKYLREASLENFPPARTLVGDVQRWVSTEVEDWVRSRERKQ